jgi:hypothetical protein
MGFSAIWWFCPGHAGSFDLQTDGLDDIPPFRDFFGHGLRQIGGLVDGARMIPWASRIGLIRQVRLFVARASAPVETGLTSEAAGWNPACPTPTIRIGPIIFLP